MQLSYLRLIIIIYLLLVGPFEIMSILAFWPLAENNWDYKTAIVFGAGVKPDKNPTLVLKNRLDKAAWLYQSGKIKNILVSGDNREVNYNEPAAMKSYLVKMGVNQADILEDFAGRRTADTCYRAKNVFNLEKAVLITQAFHMPRSAFLCQAFGMQIRSEIANDSYLSTTTSGLIREIPASWVALKDSLGYTSAVGSNGLEQKLEN